MLPPEEATVILRYYDITAEGDMESTPGRNVLRVATAPETIGQELTLPVPKVEALLASGKARLLQARNARQTPVVDRTFYADRNGMLISAYFEASAILGREELKRFALKSLEFLLAHLRADDGGLYHAFADGKAHVSGLLDDYVWVTAALLHAFQVTGQLWYLATAKELMETALRTLWDDSDGGFFDLRPDPTALGPLKRPSKAIEDTSMPSPNAMAAIVLDQLAALTNEPRYQQRAERLLEAFAGRTPEFGCCRTDGVCLRGHDLFAADQRAGGRDSSGHHLPTTGASRSQPG